MTLRFRKCIAHCGNQLLECRSIAGMDALKASAENMYNFPRLTQELVTADHVFCQGEQDMDRNYNNRDAQMDSDSVLACWFYRSEVFFDGFKDTP